MDSHSSSKANTLTAGRFTAIWVRLKVHGGWSTRISRVREQPVEKSSIAVGSTTRVKRQIRRRRDLLSRMMIECQRKDQRHNHQICKLAILCSKRGRTRSSIVSTT